MPVQKAVVHPWSVAGGRRCHLEGGNDTGGEWEGKHIPAVWMESVVV